MIYLAWLTLPLGALLALAVIRFDLIPWTLHAFARLCGAQWVIGRSQCQGCHHNRHVLRAARCLRCRLQDAYAEAQGGQWARPRRLCPGCGRRVSIMRLCPVIEGAADAEDHAERCLLCASGGGRQW